MSGNDSRVTVVDIRMPFLSMVVFMVKWVIASIPAIIILAVLGSVLFSMFGSFFSGTKKTKENKRDATLYRFCALKGSVTFPLYLGVRGNGDAPTLSFPQ